MQAERARPAGTLPGRAGRLSVADAAAVRGGLLARLNKAQATVDPSLRAVEAETAVFLEMSR